MRINKTKTFVGIQYAGLSGISKECADAVMRLLQYGDKITHVRILTCTNVHCLLLTVNVGDLIAVKSGFGSGYLGEGSRTFSYILQLLETHGAEIEEYKVDQKVIERLDISALTVADIDKINSARPARPSQWHEYIFENHFEKGRIGELWQEFDPVIPFAIIDNRIFDLAIRFWDGPDDCLFTGYRRLEDLVRKRTGLDEHGQKLFSQAFQGSTAKLVWKVIDNGEQAGRASLFIAAYMAYRNPRAHRELERHAGEQLAEFLLLNHLYLLEKESCEGTAEDQVKKEV